MHPTKRRRRREDHDITRLQDIHRRLVGIQADEPPVFRHVNQARLRGELFRQSPVRRREARIEHIRHRDKFDGPALGRERLAGRSCAATAAADERHLNQVAAGRVHVG